MSHFLTLLDTNQSIAIPDVIDYVAAKEGPATWAINPRPCADNSYEWQELSFSDLAQAVNNMAWWIEETVGLGRNNATLGYMGANDLRYAIVVAAALKAGYTAMFTSPRNFLEGQVSLVNKTSCRAFLYTPEVELQVQQLKNAVPDLQIYMAPSLSELLHPEATHGHYVGHHSKENEAHCLILHSSGSTGLPKPIYWTTGGIGTLGWLASLPPEGGYRQMSEVFFTRKSLLAAAPFFHAMGVIVIARSILTQCPIITLPSDRILNSTLVMEAIKRTKPWSGMFAPSLLEDLSSTEDGLKALGTLDYVFFAGAPLNSESGNKISKVTNLVTVIGSTESVLYPSLLPDSREDWNYFHWSSAAGVVMEQVEEGLYEMVVKRNRDIRFQGLFHMFPQLEIYRTKDLFEAHPSKENLWRYIGRRDDIIVLSNGEKFNPVSTEKKIEGHPLVNGAIVVGQGRFQTGLLLEPDWTALTTNDWETFIDNVWPLVEEANSEVPTYARIYKSRVAISKQDKPFVRTGKGSIIRRMTLVRYEREIDALYSNEGLENQLGYLETGADRGAIREFLRRAFLLNLPAFKEDTAEDTDIFQLGADSLDVLAIASAINHAIEATRKDVTVTARTIYDYPTLGMLTAALDGLLNHAADSVERGLSREQKMIQMVNKYTSNLPDRPSGPYPRLPQKQTVVLTGSTGSLGNMILELLITSPAIEKIYSLNRSADAEKRQKISFLERSSANQDFSKVSFLQSDFSTSYFGLSKDTYNAMLLSVTVFIHSAWTVDFNVSLESFEPVHIAGTRRAIDFALAAKFRPSIFFISSIASVGNWNTKHGGSLVPETVATLFDNELPFAQGYAESKHVASQILAIASDRSGLKSAVIRAGQLAGPSEEQLHGIWNRHEWLPTLVATSKALGKIPKSLGSQDKVDWVPMDKAAGTIVDLVMTAVESSFQEANTGKHGKDEVVQNIDVFHLVNPRVVSWGQLYPVVQEFYSQTPSKNAKAMEEIDYKAWLDELRKIPATKANAEKIPGLKLLDFYSSLDSSTGTAGLPSLETVMTQRRSATLRNLQPVNASLMRKWLQQWKF